MTRDKGGRPPEGVPLYVGRTVPDADLEERVRALEIEKARLEEHITSMREARELQAKEYERRLFDLNHAHVLAQERNADYLPREVYEKSEKERLTWQNAIDKDMAGATSKTAAYAAMFAAVLSLAGIGLGIYAAFTG